MSDRRIAIITARGGSKRIPNKNIKDFCGKPIIAYSIKAALESQLFSEVMVSTDSEKIAEIAKEYGAEVPFLRSAKTSDDYATTADVIVEVLKAYQERNQHFMYACCLYPTAPFVTPRKLKEAMKIMEEKEPIEIMPVVQFSCPPQRSLVIDEDGNMGYRYPEYRLSRSQDLEKLYYDAGQFYVYNVKKYLEVSGNVSEGILPIIVPAMEVQDIDTQEDWEIAELKYQLMQDGAK